MKEGLGDAGPKHRTNFGCRHRAGHAVPLRYVTQRMQIARVHYNAKGSSVS
jgi:hypothetical protein